MGATGETFIVGPDELMRSNSRLFLEDPEAYKRDVIAAGTPPDVAESAIRQHGTTLVQPVATDATKLAQQGQRGHPDRRRLSGPRDAAGLRARRHPRAAVERRRQDRHVRGVRPGLGVHQEAGAVDGGDHLRGLHRRDAAGAALRPPDPPARERCAADQLRRLRDHHSRGVPRRIRRPDSRFQRHEPEPGDQGGSAQRTAAGERPHHAVADARAGGGALPRR